MYYYNLVSKFPKLEFFNKMSIYSGRVASFLVLVLILLVSISVTLRYLFSIGFTWLQDLYIWVHACAISLAIAYTLKRDSHVRIDIIYRKLSKNSKRKVDFFGSLIFGLPVCYIIIVHGYEYFLRSFLINEGSKESGGLPNLFILKFFIFFMGVLIFLEIINKIFIFFKSDD